MAKTKASVGDDTAVTIYLVNATSKALDASEKEIRADQDRVTKLIKSLGAKCILYQTPGGPYDYVSVVTGLSSIADAIRIAESIGEGGLAKATYTLLSKGQVLK